MLCSTGLCRQGRCWDQHVDQTPAESQSPRGEENGATRAPPSRAAAARQPRAARATMLHLQGAALAMHPLHGPATGPCPPRSACTAATSGAINRAAGARRTAPRAPAARTGSMCALPCSSCEAHGGVGGRTAESVWVVCRAPVARRRGWRLMEDSCSRVHMYTAVPACLPAAVAPRNRISQLWIVFTAVFTAHVVHLRVTALLECVLLKRLGLYKLICICFINTIIQF